MRVFYKPNPIRVFNYIQSHNYFQQKKQTLHSMYTTLSLHVVVLMYTVHICNALCLCVFFKARQKLKIIITYMLYLDFNKFPSLLFILTFVINKKKIEHNTKQTHSSLSIMIFVCSGQVMFICLLIVQLYFASTFILRCFV